MTVTDANGCTEDLTETITQPAEALDVSIPNVTNVLCFGDATGAASPLVLGGTPPYTYSWVGPGSYASTDESITGLLAGTYTLTVTDDNGCFDSESVVITEPDALPTPTAADVSECYDGNTFTATASYSSPATGVIYYDAPVGGNVVAAPSASAVGVYTAWAASVDANCESPGRVLVTLTIYALPVLSIEPVGFDNDHVFSGCTYTWNLIKDGFVTGTHDATFTHPFTGEHIITYTDYSDPGDCETTVTDIIMVKPNKLAGQVKYYNSQESPMPSPFMANDNGMPVPDYFYVSLITDDISEYNPESDDPQSGPSVLETKTVNELYWEPTLTSAFTFEAAFAFDANLDPAKKYRVVVWDGGMYEEHGYFWNYGALGMNWTWNNWGGVNATDALLNQHMSIGNINGGGWNSGPIAIPHLSAAPYFNGSDYTFAYNVADVNGSHSITALDALLTSRRAVGLIQKFINSKSNFEVAGFIDQVDTAYFITDPDMTVEYFRIFDNALPGNVPTNLGPNVSPPAIEFTKRTTGVSYLWNELAMKHNYYTDTIKFGCGESYMNIYYNAVGDINSSYVPMYGAFKDAAMELEYESLTAVQKGDEITIPISLSEFTELGALSLGLDYRKDLVEVIATSYGEDMALIDHEAGKVQIAWASLDPVTFNADDAVVLITLRVIGDIDAGTRIFELNGFTEIADANANVIEDVTFKTSALSTNGADFAGDFNVVNYPNPFNESTDISYTLPEAGAVTIKIYNEMGQLVKTLINDYQNAGIQKANVAKADLSGPGVYYYKLDFKGENETHTSSKSMILLR